MRNYINRKIVRINSDNSRKKCIHRTAIFCPQMHPYLHEN